MNITDNLIRIKEGKDNIIISLKNKGVSISENTLINEIPTIIDNAEIGGGGDTPDVPELVQKYEGASVFRINVPTDNYEFAINLCNNASTATYDVDWGDGVLQSGLTTDEQHHIYSKKGVYDVNVYNLSKDISLGGRISINSTNSAIIYFLFNNSNNDYWGGNKYSYQTDNTTVTNVLIGKGVTKIDNYAFNGCSSLQSIVISDYVTSISNNTFQNCTSLQSVVIPNSVTSMNSYTFSNCSSLQSVVIPNSVTSIGGFDFENCTSLQNIVIPKGVTSIGNNTFQNCTSLQSVVIPNSVTSINSSVFEKCTSLQSVVIPNSVTSINSSAFSNCNSLQSIVIPDSVTSIGYNAFYQCYYLQSIVIPEGVTSIAKNTFQNCSSLQSIVIPKGVTSIGNQTFASCLCLQSITCLNPTAPTIQSNSFPTSSLKYSKRYLYVPKESTGYNEGNWKTYLIDKGWELRYIEDKPEKTPTTLKLKTKNNFLHKWEYLGGGKLIDYELVDNEYIYHFDDKIMELIQYTFYNKVLEEIELPEGVEILSDYLFYEVFKLSTVNIPSTVTSIGKYCFYRTAIKEITIPEGITLLPDYMCDTCVNLKTVNIPSTVTSIGKRCFTQNSSLRTIISKSTQAPTIQSDTFQSIASSGTRVLRVPEGAEGYEEGYWKSTVLDKGYTLEYVPLSEL